MFLYADENFPHPVSEALRSLGHDVLTVQQDDRRGTPDPDILARAHELGRVVLTHNRRHFQGLHIRGAEHSGIISASRDPNDDALTARIHTALMDQAPGRWCVRVTLPP